MVEEQQREPDVMGAKPRIGSRVMAELMRAQVENALFGAAAEPSSSEAPTAAGEIEIEARADTPGTVLVGRFQLQGILGRGGMGEVFAAYDPELRRSVAIKLLRSLPDGDAAHSRRLRREAAAIARLSHPNIIQVYDVGEAGGQVYVAMELVEGTSLRRWLAQRPRSHQEIMDAFVQAGKGLAAAHSRGIVHRDFKMGNVLVGNDGRVRVIDFGLARRAQGVPDRPMAPIEASGEQDEASTDHRKALGLGTLTKTGQAVGTPGYMAPEQRAGRPAVAATDQYAFCVSLFEALTGIRPRQGSRPGASSAVDPGLPAALGQVLGRGMADRPEDRWPSMGALLEALARSSWSRRRWRWPLVGVAVGLSAVGLWLAARPSTERSACDLPDVVGGWSDERRQAMLEGIEAAAAEHAGTSGAWLVDRIEHYAHELGQSRASLCEVPRRNDGQRACLAQRRVALESTVEALTIAEPLTIAHGPELVAALPPVQSCAVATASPGVGDFDDELERRILALRLRLMTREPVDLRDQVSALQKDARRGGAPVQVLEGGLLLGLAEEARGRIDEAAARYEAVYLDAHGDGYDDVATEAALRMTTLVPKWSRGAEPAVLWAERVCSEILRAEGTLGTPDCERARARAQVAGGEDELAIASLERALAQGPAQDLSMAPDMAQTWLSLARAHLRRGHASPALAAVESAEALVSRSLGRVHPRYAEVLLVRASLHDQRGEYDQAMTCLDRASVLLRRALGEDHPALADVLERRSRILAARGDFERATELTRRVLVLRQGSMDSSHVDLAKTLYNLGLLAWAQGREDEAMQALSRAKEIYYRTYGPDHIEVAPVLELLGHRASRAGQPAEALRHYDQALEIRRAAHGPEHASVAMALDHRFDPLRALGREAEAEQTVRQAIEILEATLGSEHPRLVPALTHLGQHLVDRGELSRAMSRLDRAIDIGTEAWGATSANLREPLVVRAELALRAGRTADAAADAQRALATVNAGGGPDELTIRVHRVLAQTLREQGQVARADEHARRAAELVDEQRSGETTTEERRGPGVGVAGFEDQ